MGFFLTTFARLLGFAYWYWDLEVLLFTEINKV